MHRTTHVHSSTHPPTAHTTAGTHQNNGTPTTATQGLGIATVGGETTGETVTHSTVTIQAAVAANTLANQVKPLADVLCMTCPPSFLFSPFSEHSCLG